MFNFMRWLLLALTVATAFASLHDSSGIDDGLIGYTDTTTPDVPNAPFQRRSLTNGELLSRGLPPRAPHIRRFIPGRRTPTMAARSSTASPIMRASIIAVTRFDNGAPVGYINEAWAGAVTKRHGVTASTTSALHVSFASGPNPLEITRTGNAPDPSYPYLGFVVGPSNTDPNISLSPGSPNYFLLTGTKHTDANAPATVVGNAYANTESESTIWNFNEVTSELTVNWVNADGSKLPTYIVYYPGSNALAITGDVAAFTESFASSYRVKMTFV